MSLNMNYQIKMDEMLKKITQYEMESGKLPTLLLHACCAPCSSYVLEYLSNFFSITVFFYNPNISEEEEYKKRVDEVKRFIREFPTKHEVSFLEGDYRPEDFEQAIGGMEHYGERSVRCHACYELRLRSTARVAKELGFDYFTTTLSISPYKNARWLNEIGEQLSQEYDVNYLYADFKKKNGYKRSIELSAQYKLYRQDFCGCKYSKEEEEKRKAGKLEG